MYRADVCEVSSMTREIINSVMRYQTVPAPEGFAHIAVNFRHGYIPFDKTIDDIQLQIQPCEQEIEDAEKLRFLFNEYSMPLLNQLNLGWRADDVSLNYNLLLDRYIDSLYKQLFALLDDRHSKQQSCIRKRDKRLRYKKNKRDNREIKNEE
jgi:hypothetical protein